jgi:hypothetical protein
VIAVNFLGDFTDSSLLKILEFISGCLPRWELAPHLPEESAYLSRLNEERGKF